MYVEMLYCDITDSGRVVNLRKTWVHSCHRILMVTNLNFGKS